MAFVFSFWCIIAVILIAGVAACLIAFFLMDKKDRVLIKEFVDSNASQEESSKTEEVSKEEGKIE